MTEKQFYFIERSARDLQGRIAELMVISTLQFDTLTIHRALESISQIIEIKKAGRQTGSQINGGTNESIKS
jgi:TolA-binding protein